MKLELARKITKAIVPLVVSTGAASIVRTIIRDALPEQHSLKDKVLMNAGLLGIGMAVGEIASKPVAELVDNVFDCVDISYELIAGTTSDEEDRTETETQPMPKASTDRVKTDISEVADSVKTKIRAVIHDDYIEVGGE